MKKTLITLLALGGLAMGETTLQDGLTFSTSTCTLPDGWTEVGASVTMVLDVEAFAQLFDTATGTARPVFASMVGNDKAIFGLEAHEDNRITGSYGVTAGGTYNNLYSLPNSSGDSIGSITWSNVKAAALTMSYTYANGTSWSLTVLDNAGNYTNLATPNTTLRNQNATDITSFAVDTDVVTQAYAFDGFFRDDAAFALNQQAIKAALVPEPTTATLSLLALCGLAMRRRRK